jgi:nucleoside 2-deoxyribosyltransferase
MRIYIAYKFTGQDKELLKKRLHRLADSIEQNGHETFVFYRDIVEWGTKPMERKDIMPIALKELQKSDLLLLYIEEYSKSTGVGLEVGYAKASQIPIILAAPKNEDCDYLMGLYDEFVEFEDFEDLVKQIGKTIAAQDERR